MTTFTTVPDTNLEPGDPIRSVDIIAIKDNTNYLYEKLNAADIQTFNSSGTWTKPSINGTIVGRLARIQVWGGGGGGARAGSFANGNTGGGGGGYNEVLLPLSSLGATVTVTVGAGGAGRTSTTGAGTAGGNSSFGSHCAAFGGGPGQIISSSRDSISSGGSNTRAGVGKNGLEISPNNYNPTGILYVLNNDATPQIPAVNRPYYTIFQIPTDNTLTNLLVGAVVPTLSDFHGGNSYSFRNYNAGTGAGSFSGVNGVATDALYGGGAGAPFLLGFGDVGGRSVYGGQGGGIGQNGTAPGGGGGVQTGANAGNGAAGRVIVTVF